MRSFLPILLLSLAAEPFCWAGCDSGSIAVSGIASNETEPDTVTIVFVVELASDSFDAAKKAGDEFTAAVRRLAANIPDEATLTVGYDFGALRQKKISWSKGKRLEYVIAAHITGLPAGSAQETTVRFVDGALELDGRLAVESVSAGLSEELLAELDSQLLTRALSRARERAETLAASADLRLARVDTIHEGLREPDHADGYAPLGGRSYANMLVLRRSFTVDAGVPAIERSRAITATFCTAPL